MKVVGSHGMICLYKIMLGISGTLPCHLPFTTGLAAWLRVVEGLGTVPRVGSWRSSEKKGQCLKQHTPFCLLNCHLFLGFQNWMMNDKAVKKDGPGNSL